MKLKILLSTLYLTAILFFFTNSLFAKEVDPKVVKTVALNAYSQCTGSLKSNLNILEEIIISEKEKKAFTIFNFKEGGFIIVSNDDAAEPILGFGFNSSLNLDSIPPGLNFLLNEYKNEILNIKENQTTSSSEIKEKWEMYSVSDGTNSMKSYTIGTTLLLTLWNQDAGYQALCPEDPITHLTSKVGCGGVALGQILHYWGCRVFPDSYVSYLPPNFQNNISIYFYNQTYNWSSMDVDSPDNENKKLLYHCAVSLESKFGFFETSHLVAAVPFALWNYWGFNSGTTKNKNDYLSTWTSLLRNEIDNGRPIYYGGTDITVSPNTAHAWVVDGYRTSDNTYHCNWGWGGYENNWFTLTDLTPGTSNYNSSQLAVMGIYPKLDACSGLTGESVICYPDTVQYSVTIPSTASVSWGKTGNLSVVGSSTNPTFSVRSTSNSGASGTITATIKNSQNQTFLTRTKTVWVGKPATPTAIYPFTYNGMEFGSNTEYEFHVTPQIGATSYTWSVGGGTITDGQGTYSIYVKTGNATDRNINFSVAVKANGCGESLFFTRTGWVVPGSGGGSRIVLSPNPATDETTMTIETTSPEGSVDQTVEWEMEVYDPLQNLKEKKTKLMGNSAKLQTAGWKEGVYIVRVKYKDEILTGKLVVKK